MRLKLKPMKEISRGELVAGIMCIVAGILIVLGQLG